MKRLLLAAVAVALTALPAFAAELGRVEFGGREIILNDDNTWAYAPSAISTLECGTATPMVSARIAVAACIDPAVWSAADPIGDQEFLYFSTDGKAALAVIPESIDVSMEQYRDVIIQVAGQAAGIDASQIQASEDTNLRSNGKTWKSFRYNLVVDGQEFAYLNYRLAESGIGAVQFVFWTLPGDEAVSDQRSDEVIETAVFGD